MKHPENDVKDRSPIWDAMQMFWMDTDPNLFLEDTAELCFNSKYSIKELEHIYWNEVRPAVSLNLFMLSASEWRGFEIEGLKKLILKKHKFGKRLPIKLFHRYSNSWWVKLKNKIEYHSKNDS